MHLAIINNQTNVVENIAVPPQGSGAFFVSSGYYGVLTDVGSIGDVYENGSFIKPEAS